MSDVQQQKHEPQIIVGDLNNEELASWMGNKVHAIGCLSSAISNRESLERRLAEVNAEIERYSADAAIDVIRSAEKESSSEAAEPKKGRVVELIVNGALLVSFNTSRAVAADYLNFIQAVIGTVSCQHSLEEEANRSGKTISHTHFEVFGSLPITQEEKKLEGAGSNFQGCDLALVKLLLSDSKELNKIKPSHSTSQNIRIAESFLKCRSSVEHAYQVSMLINETAS